jgi:hypothetical protein
MSSDLHMGFQMGGHVHDVDLKAQSSDKMQEAQKKLY